MGRSFGRDKTFTRRATPIGDLLGSLLGGGIPLLFGIIFVPVGIHFIAQGEDTESLGWIFAIMGVITALIGIILVVALWPERTTEPEE